MTEEIKFDSETENYFESGENEAPTLDEKVFELPHTITLKEPIVLTTTKTLTEVTFSNKVTVKMMGHLPAQPELHKMGHFVPIIAGMIGEPHIVINKMSYEDFQQSMEVAGYFLGRSNPKSETGGTTSE